MYVDDTVSSWKPSICLEVNLRDTSRLEWDYLWPKCTNKHTVTCFTYHGISHTAYLSLNPSVWMCKCFSKSEWTRQTTGRERTKEKRCKPPTTAPKMKYHSISTAIKACHSSMTQMYQDIKCLTDVKRVKKHVEMWKEGLWERKYIGSESTRTHIRRFELSFDKVSRCSSGTVTCK